MVIQYKVRDLLWRPAGRLVRFVAVIHPTRGSCLLMCTDTSLAAIKIIRLYALRFKIEHTFKQAVRLIGSFSYHFWMSDMKPLRRRSGNQHLHRASPQYRDAVRRRLLRRSTRSQSAFAPFLLGIAVVLIPCGVTISMMLLAATAGSRPAGGAVMALFVAGTAPMFAAYGFVTQRYVNPDSRRVSVALGAVVVLMGLFTLNAGATAMASPVTAQSIAASVFACTRPPPAGRRRPRPGRRGAGAQIDATSGGYSPSSVAAKAGVPTKVVFHTDNTAPASSTRSSPPSGSRSSCPRPGTPRSTWAS